MKPIEAADTSRYLLAPMPGQIISVAAAVGDAVEAGQELAVIEAMKCRTCCARRAAASSNGAGPAAPSPVRGVGSGGGAHRTARRARGRSAPALLFGLAPRALYKGAARGSFVRARVRRRARPARSPRGRVNSSHSRSTRERLGGALLDLRRLVLGEAEERRDRAPRTALAAVEPGAGGSRRARAAGTAILSVSSERRPPSATSNGVGSVDVTLSESVSASPSRTFAVRCVGSGASSETARPRGGRGSCAASSRHAEPLRNLRLGRRAAGSSAS